MLNRDVLWNYFSRRDRAWILLLLLAVAVIYLPFLGNPFVFDDLSFFQSGAVEAYSHKPFDFSLRWFPYASLGKIYVVFSDEFPHIYHLSNLLLHAANTLLLFYLLRKLIDTVRPAGIQSPARAAWFGALVFGLHPVAVFAVGYVIQISILMATMFALIMQLLYLHGLLSGKKRWFVLSVFAYFLACFSKEHSVLVPAVLVAMQILVSTGRRARWRVILPTWGAYIGIAVVVTLRAKGVLGSSYEPMAAQLFEQQGIEANTTMLHVLSALTQAGLFFKYLMIWILPDPTLMSIDMRESFVTSVGAWQAWIGGIAFVLYGAYGIWLLLRGGKFGLTGFAMLYPWLLFWVEMVGIRVQEPFVLYRSYLWMPGMMLFIPTLLMKFPERKAMFALIGVAIVLIPLSWGRLWVFADNYRLWNEAASMLKNDQEAGADRIFYNRGQAEMAEKKWGEAATDFERAKDISPNLEAIRYILGVAYTNSGRFEDALIQYDAAIAIKPDDGRIYFSKGMTLKFLHRDKEAMQQMEYGCKLGNQVACLIVLRRNDQKK